MSIAALRVVRMTTATVTPPALHLTLQRQAPKRREITTRSVSADSVQWFELGRMSASDAAARLLFVTENSAMPHEALDGATIAYHRVDHAQIALHHHDQVLARRKPRDCELNFVWIPTDDLDVHLMQRAGRPVTVTRENGKLCGMTPKDGHSLPFNRDYVQVVEGTFGYEADSSGHWPLVVDQPLGGPMSVVPAAQRDFGLMHLILGKDRLRILNLSRTQANMARPYEEMNRARLLGYDGVTFRDHIVSAAHGIQTVAATALFPESRAKLSHVTLPAHPYDWPETSTKQTLTPDFLGWHRHSAKIVSSRAEA